MAKTIKYVGTIRPYRELAVTGKPAQWMPGQIESRADAEATSLLGTGSFVMVPTNPVIVVGSDAPVDGDGLPDGTIYIQTT